MTQLLSALAGPARIVVAILFNSLWLSALLAGVVWLVLRFIPNINATTRYAAWTLCLLACVMLPFVLTPAHLSLQQQNPVQPASGAVTSVRHTTARRPDAVKPQPRQIPQPVVATAAAEPRLHFAVPAPLAQIPFALWALVAAAILARLAVSLWRLEGLKRDALPLSLDVRDRLATWDRAEKGSRDVRLCVSDRINVPVAIGLFDSLILIPKLLVGTLSQTDIDQITLHELAHLRRGDDWTNCIQRLIEAVFFFNPAMLWISRQLDLEREIACDDWVVTQTGGVRPYAVCLTRMAEVTAWPHRALAAPGVFTTRKGLSIRVERLLVAGRNIGTRIAFGPAGIVTAVVVLLFLVSQSVVPSIAFTLPAPPAPPAIVPERPIAAARVLHPATTHPHVQHAHALQSRGLPVLGSPPTLARAPHPPSLPVIAQGASSVAASSARTISSGMNCTACDLSGIDWHGKDLRGTNLLGSDLANADLHDADFAGANLTGVNLHGANLRNTNFSAANLSGADLSGAHLDGAVFTSAKLSGTRLDIALMSASQARTVLALCRGCDFSHANLANQDLHGVTLDGADLSGADLRGADLRGAHFTGVDFSNSKLAGARLDGAVFSGCDFSGVDLRNVDLSRTVMTGSNLVKAILH
jgi:uncharacterized protein YjbI with pentapeptide repeats/beta-lactamase regulating signal transducer with metallopeptidase domain